MVLIESFFGKPPRKGVHPDEVVALGAAILAHALESGENPITLVDVVPVAIGGLWMALFFRNLKQRPLLPLQDPKAWPLLEPAHD